MIVCSTSLFNVIRWPLYEQNRSLGNHIFYCMNNIWCDYDNDQVKYDFNLPDIYPSTVITLKNIDGSNDTLAIHHFLRRQVYQSSDNYKIEASSKFHQMMYEDFIQDSDKILHEDESIIGNSKVGHIRNSRDSQYYNFFVDRENKKLEEIIVREKISIESITKTIYWRMSVENFNEIPDHMKE